MPKVDGTNNNNNSGIPLYDNFLLKQQSLAAFNSIFTKTAADNNLIEASDFQNYKQGQNSFIDNLIASGKTWSEDIVNKVIDSIRVMNKKENVRISNAPVKITIGDGVTKVTEFGLDKLENILDITSGGVRKTLETLSKVDFYHMGFDSEEQEVALEELKKFCRLKFPEAINVYAKVDEIKKLNVLSKEIEPQRSEIFARLNAATEEEKQQIRETAEVKDFLKRYAELRQECNKKIGELKIALKNLEMMSLTKEAAGIEAIYDSADENFNESLKCVLTFTDANGEPKDTNLHIRLDFIEDYKSRNCTPETPYSQVVKQIVNEFKNEIDKLPQQVKDDLYNEVADIHLLTKNSNGVLGLYNQEASTIKLHVPAGHSYAGYSSVQPFNIKSAVDSLVHEIGHAIDEKDSNYASEAFQSKFNEYTALLVNKGIIPKNYKENLNSYYSLTSEDEFFAEVIYAGQNGQKSDFGGAKDALQSQDPEVQAKLKELYQLGNEILAERRSYSREERIGLKKGGIFKEISKNDEGNKAYNNIIYSLRDDMYQKYGNNIQRFLEAYYVAKSNPEGNSEEARLMKTLKQDYPDDWEKMAEVFDEHLKKNGLL